LYKVLLFLTEYLCISIEEDDRFNLGFLSCDIGLNKMPA
jgi:hypothetical protein